MQEVPAVSCNDIERWTRRNVIRMEAAFENQPAGHIPVKRLDVLLALGRAGVSAEMMQCFADIYPLTCAHPDRDRVRPPQHSVSIDASSIVHRE